jgi:hypothetical protein
MHDHAILLGNAMHWQQATAVTPEQLFVNKQCGACYDMYLTALPACHMLARRFR